MSSSEVQRTLVKSPPELWAELGDPAALARHLGGLGEIRITRIDPEQSVEWESEDASGTVLIKPSGWGTKVTLTVTRKTPEPTATPALAAGGAEDAPAEPVAEADHAGEDESTVETDRTDQEPLGLPEQPAPAESTAGAEQPAQAESASTAHAVEPDPPVEAEPAVEADPAQEAEPEPALHSEPDPELDPELLPRRGFFARLFGRRPRKEAAEPQSSEIAVAAVWQPGALDGTVVAEPLAPVVAAEPQAEPLAPVVAAEPQPDPTEMIGAAQVAPEPPAVIVAEEPHAEPPAAAAHENAAEELDGPPRSAGESPEEGPSDPAAAAETPEQDASAEVTEVLTAVLDRLGSAHHRPFSRG